VTEITKLEICFSTEFSQAEVTQVTEAFSAILPIDQKRYVRMSAEALPAVLIFVLGVVAGSVAGGFFNEMGSDLYQKAKKSVISAFGNKYKPTVEFKMNYSGTEISISASSNDKNVLEKVFDTIDKAKELAITELDKKETPEMNKLEIVYENSWQLTCGTNWQPTGKPRIIRFYDYDKHSGKWKLTRDWSES
jgi:hypothetical protein